MDMEHATCNVIYVDRAVSRDRYIHSTEPGPDDAQDRIWETSHIAENVELLLNVFGEGWCPSSAPFATPCLARPQLTRCPLQFTCAALEVPASPSCSTCRTRPWWI